MAHLLVLVIDNEEFASAILEAWEIIGLPGMTKFDSTGSRSELVDTRDDLPFVVSLRAVTERGDKPTTTFFSAIESQAILEQATAAVLRIIPDFELGHQGIMFTVPIARVWGSIDSVLKR